MRVLGAVAVPSSTRPFFSKDGSSLSGWTNVGCTTSTLQGNGAPSIFAAGGQYAYISVPQGLIGKTIKFDVRILESSNGLANFYYGVDANGKGQMLRLDTRANSYSGLIDTTSWTSWNAPSTADVMYRVNMSVWYNISITIGRFGNDSAWYLNGNYMGSWVPSINGNYIAVHGDGAGVGGAHFDNIKIYYRDL